MGNDESVRLAACAATSFPCVWKPLWTPLELGGVTYYYRTPCQLVVLLPIDSDPVSLVGQLKDFWDQGFAKGQTGLSRTRQHTRT